MTTLRNENELLRSQLQAITERQHASVEGIVKQAASAVSVVKQGAVAIGRLAVNIEDFQSSAWIVRCSFVVSILLFLLFRPPAVVSTCHQQSDSECCGGCAWNDFG